MFVVLLLGVLILTVVAGWLAHPASPSLMVTEARFYGDLRAVVRLQPVQP